MHGNAFGPLSNGAWVEGSHGVKAHTPDETAYHFPDSGQLSHIRPGVMGVVVPRANYDGSSKGFSCTEPGAVHVDPQAPDGGVVVDLSHLREDRFAKAFERALYPHEVYYQIGHKPSAEEMAGQTPVQAASPNPHVPANSYVAPQTGPVPPGTYSTYSKEKQPVKPLPTMPAAPPPPSPVPPAAAPVYLSSPPAQIDACPPQPPQAAYYPPQPGYYPPQPPSQDFSQIMGAIGQLTQVVSGLVQQRVVPPVSEPEVEEEEELPAVPLRTQPRGRSTPQPLSKPKTKLAGKPQAPAGPSQPRDGMIVGFETLDLPFVSGPLPTRPTEQVYFEMGQRGTISAKYHAVCDAKQCLALVFDTRYEDGFQYLPPDTGQERITVRLAKRSYSCASLGIHFTLGVFDVIVLIKGDEEEGEPAFATDFDEEDGYGFSRP